MIGRKIKAEDFDDRKTYLVVLAIQYIEEHTGYMGIDDDVLIDGVECDGFALAEDLRNEFDINC